jgi:hypothetical protein
MSPAPLPPERSHQRLTLRLGNGAKARLVAASTRYGLSAAAIVKRLIEHAIAEDGTTPGLPADLLLPTDQRLTPALEAAIRAIVREELGKRARSV